MNIDILKYLGSGAKMMAMLPLNLLSGNAQGNYPVRISAAWNEEKQEILTRANWLCEKIDVDSESLLRLYPSFIGSMYVGQWAIYTCSMLVAALHNISRLYPEERAWAIDSMVKPIEHALAPALRRFDAEDWKEDPLDGVKGNKGHFTYLTSIAWMIGVYRLAGGDCRFDNTLHDCCDGINKRMSSGKDMNVVSFRNNIVFISDMVLACVALQNYAKLFGCQYAETARRWLEMAKKELIHKPTGLLMAEKRYRWNPRVRGSYTALTNYFLTLLDDKEFARDQYDRMVKVFRRQKPYAGIKEFLRQGDGFKFDMNAGPMLYGLSTSGTALAIGTATFFEDWEYRNQMLLTADALAQTTKSSAKCHYRLAEVAPVGEAFVLAMRTNIDFDNSRL